MTNDQVSEAGVRRGRGGLAVTYCDSPYQLHKVLPLNRESATDHTRHVLPYNADLCRTSLAPLLPHPPACALWRRVSHKLWHMPSIV